MPMTDTRRAFLQIHGCVLLWGFTAILGKLITLPALPLVFEVPPPFLPALVPLLPPSDPLLPLLLLPLVPLPDVPALRAVSHEAVALQSSAVLLQADS